jgi:hypothetical protein
VEFGYGVIGHVEQGGTTEITRVHLSPGVWKTSREKIDINGRFVVLKTINKHQDESRTDFEPVAPDTTFAQALNEIGKKIILRLLWDREGSLFRKVRLRYTPTSRRIIVFGRWLCVAMLCILPERMVLRYLLLGTSHA